jgi:hypothetical protein
MNVFLVFEMVPEDMKAYFIQNVSDEDLDILDKANGKYINTDSDSEAVSEILDFVSEDIYCEDPDKETNGKWLKDEVKYSGKKGPFFDASEYRIDRVYMCGMIM